LGYLPRPKVLDLMQASDLFVFPSPTETQGMVVLEAMGRGTPVLGVDAMGVGQMMRGERGGWLARPDDMADLGGKLAAALADPSARATKAAEALVMAREYSADAINAKLAGFYQGLIRERR
jgi:glycosyltransferase involved in cell wall biosynthesis